MMIMEPGPTLVFSIAGSRMDMRWSFAFVARDTKTHLTATAELRPKGVIRLMSPLLGPMMRRTFARRPAQIAAGVAARRRTSPEPDDRLIS